MTASAMAHAVLAKLRRFILCLSSVRFQDLVVVLAGCRQRRAQRQPLVAELDRQARDLRGLAVRKRELDHAAGIEVRIVEERARRLDAGEGKAAFLADALELGD